MAKPRWFSLVALAILAVSASAQTQLSLDEALKMAQQKNGDLAAARKQIEAARARANQARAAFFPTITPSIIFNDNRNDFLTGNGGGSFTSIQSDLTTAVDLKWQVLDSGERGLQFDQARKGLDAQTLQTLQTLRTTLFTVYQQYFEVIRTQELVRTATAQVERAQKSFDQAKKQFEVGELAEKDTYQPKADLLNAKVDLLSAQNRRNTAEADLKATIGWDSTSPLPPLQTLPEPERKDPGTLDSLVAEGLTNRADLNAQRRLLEQQALGVEVTKRLNGLRWSLDVGFGKQFGRDNVNSRQLSISASYPLFNGGLSRENIKESQASYEASQATLTQDERVIRSDIESAYRELILNGERVDAAKVALEAAQANYDKVSRAQELGAAGADVVAVSTAQVTLVQAETNYVEAIYDYYISAARLDLVVGRPVRGEELPK